MRYAGQVLQLTLAIINLSFPATFGLAQNQLWIRQFGTNQADNPNGMTSDGAGGLYVGGYTEGSLGGPNAGLNDIWIARYDSLGNQIWIRQFGTSAGDYLGISSPDGSGGIYVGGMTRGSLGGPNAGAQDAWLARYDSAGNQVWIRQFGTASIDRLNAAATDGASGIYVSGDTLGNLRGLQAGGGDAWLARFDSLGNQLWIHQFGTTTEDGVYASAPDGSGGVYVSGPTGGALAGPYLGSGDAWLARYDGAGNSIWSRQIGTNRGELAYGAAPDGLGGVYICGFTWGGLGGPNAGVEDAWTARYDALGNQIWIGQLGTSMMDIASECSPDGAGGAFVVGWTHGSLGGQNAGTSDAWLARYDGTGNQAWILQLGTSSADTAYKSAPDASGGVYLGGFTGGSLGGPKAGGGDVWLARYESACASGPVYCTAKTNSAGCLPAISASGSPSASAGNGFSLSTTNVLHNKFGLYFYSKTGPSTIPFQGGTLCTQLPLVRTTLQNSGGLPACGGIYSIDFNAYVASGKDPALVAGQQVWIQAWSRDPGFAPPNNTSLSDAVTFTLCP
jgi:hypothetical protein